MALFTAVCSSTYAGRVYAGFPILMHSNRGKKDASISPHWNSYQRIKAGRAPHRAPKVFIVGHENSEYGVEWMRFEADAPVPELVRQVPHVAFEVSELTSELAGREILIAPNSPSDGVRVAFIVENGAPIELMEFTDLNHPDRR